MMYKNRLVKAEIIKRRLFMSSKVKKVVLAGFLLFVAMSVFGGGGGEAAGSTHTVVMGSHLNPGSPENLAMIWMSEELASRSNGRFKGEV
jgi:TRAP-type C4-dicarboxylate transport system substrate-binding protein